MDAFIKGLAQAEQRDDELFALIAENERLLHLGEDEAALRLWDQICAFRPKTLRGVVALLGRSIDEFKYGEVAICNAEVFARALAVLHEISGSDAP